MKVHVEVQRAAEALNDGHGAAAGAPHAQRPTRPTPVPPEDGAQEDLQHATAQVVAPGQEQSKAPGQRQYDLPDGYPRGQDPLHQVPRPLRHPPPPTRRTEGATAAGEGHQSVVVACGTMQVREAFGEVAAASERRQLPTHETRHRPALSFGGFDEARELASDHPAEQGAAGCRAWAAVLDRAGWRWREARHSTDWSKERAEQDFRRLWCNAGVSCHLVRQAFATHRGRGRAVAAAASRPPAAPSARWLPETLDRQRRRTPRRHPLRPRRSTVD